MKLALSNGRVNASVVGSGRTLVLFHSLLADGESFERIVPELATRFRVVVPELPGFGGSEAVSGGLAAVADRMADALRDLDDPAGPIVLGNGYGGFVALQMAVRHPRLASRLILAGCGARFSEPGREAFRAMARAAAANGLSAIVDVAMRRLFAPEFQAANPDLMAQRREGFLRTDPQVFQDACHALATLDLSADLARLETPTLALVGEHDEATPPPMSMELAGILPNVKLKVLPNCAHVPQLQSPKLFLEAMSDFLADAVPELAGQRA
ncbi:alpha/beta fold hydrolase [Roseixanthobacter glucoisosaccharinicivorans]|uniref:alpha/beta fold hydrolase n=1 Tax=Roseixanthobacter glucoisosaccharinicivorans TaxID=3119923 RepID=UPI0037267B51